MERFCFFLRRPVDESKAQVSIEFIAGFAMFIMVVSYVIYTALIIFPQYYDEPRENAIREGAWTLSMEVMYFLVNGTRLSEQSLDNLYDCGTYHHFDDPTTMADNYSRDNYTYLKELFSVDTTNDFRVTIKSSPVIITDRADGLNKTGNATIGGVDYMFESILNMTSMLYDSVELSNSSGKITTMSEENTVTLDEYTFSLSKLDTAGQFVIMDLDLVDCGKYVPMSALSSKVTRFTTYNGWITEVNIVHW